MAKTSLKDFPLSVTSPNLFPMYICSNVDFQSFYILSFLQEGWAFDNINRNYMISQLIESINELKSEHSKFEKSKSLTEVTTAIKPDPDHDYKTFIVKINIPSNPEANTVPFTQKITFDSFTLHNFNIKSINSSSPLFKRNILDTVYNSINVSNIPNNLLSGFISFASEIEISRSESDVLISPETIGSYLTLAEPGSLILTLIKDHITNYKDVSFASRETRNNIFDYVFSVLTDYVANNKIMSNVAQIKQTLGNILQKTKRFDYEVPDFGIDVQIWDQDKKAIDPDLLLDQIQIIKRYAGYPEDGQDSRRLSGTRALPVSIDVSIDDSQIEIYKSYTLSTEISQPKLDAFLQKNRNKVTSEIQQDFQKYAPRDQFRRGCSSNVLDNMFQIMDAQLQKSGQNYAHIVQNVINERLPIIINSIIDDIKNGHPYKLYNTNGNIDAKSIFTNFKLSVQDIIQDIVSKPGNVSSSINYTLSEILKSNIDVAVSETLSRSNDIKYLFSLDNIKLGFNANNFSTTYANNCELVIDMDLDIESGQFRLMPVQTSNNLPTSKPLGNNLPTTDRPQRPQDLDRLPVQDKDPEETRALAFEGLRDASFAGSGALLKNADSIAPTVFMVNIVKKERQNMGGIPITIPSNHHVPVILKCLPLYVKYRQEVVNTFASAWSETHHVRDYEFLGKLIDSLKSTLRKAINKKVRVISNFLRKVVSLNGRLDIFYNDIFTRHWKDAIFAHSDTEYLKPAIVISVNDLPKDFTFDTLYLNRFFKSGWGNIFIDDPYERKVYAIMRLLDAKENFKSTYVSVLSYSSIGLIKEAKQRMIDMTDPQALERATTKILTGGLMSISKLNSNIMKSMKQRG